MAFFAHHPYYHPQSAHRRPSPPVDHIFGRSGLATRPTPHHNYFGGRDNHYDYDLPTPSTVSLDDQEAAAIAHLRSIQRRKEAERVVREEAERERLIAQLEAQRQREREAAFARARAYEERQREIALAHASAQAQREREIALAKRARAVEVARRAELHRHLQEQRERAFAHAAARRSQEVNEQRRRQCARHCAARRAEQERLIAAAAPSTSPSPAADAHGNDGLEGLNRFLGALFGINLDVEQLGQEKKAPQSDATSSEQEKKDEQNTNAPSDASPATDVNKAKTETEPKPVAPTTTTNEEESKSDPATATETEKADFPDAINDILANFLGLRVEPESKLGQVVSSKVPEGLNELLSQFGLEFVPDAHSSQAAAGPSENENKDEKVAAATAKPASTSATPATSSQAGAAAETSRRRNPFDLSEFLSSNTNGLPPFVRDILGNVELAFKEQQEETKVEGKGKSVADGEKKVRMAKTQPSNPVPSTESAVPSVAAATTTTAEDNEDPKKTSTKSINQLESIASEVRLARDSFTFPSSLSFSHNAGSDAAPLLFNKQNKPYHAQNNKLLQLLLQADGVASNGDREVRRKRKEVVKLVEGELEALEKKRDEIWRLVKERRERDGEFSSDDESGQSWTTGSTVDHHETPVHVEDVASTAADNVEEPSKVEPSTVESKPEISDVPTTFADAVKKTEQADSDVTPAQATSAQDVTVENQDEREQEKKDDEAKKTDKEEGYELI